MRARSLSLFGLAFGLACGQADEAPSLGTLEQPIVHGAPSDESDDSTVHLLARPPGADATWCTATLIAPNLLATALHCVSYGQSGSFSCAADGSVTPAIPGDGDIGNLVPANTIQVYLGSAYVGPETGDPPAAVGTRLFGTGSTQICRNDMAFVVLDRNLDVPISKVRLSADVTWGERVHVVGYGTTDVYGATGRFSRSGVQVVDVGPATDGAATGTAAPRTFVVNEGPCHGDSGGPAFSQETGALLGVYSLSAGESCTGVGIRNVYTRLAPFSSLALDAFEAAGAEPLLEEVEAEPTAPPIVAEQGCSLGVRSSETPRPVTALLAALALAALGYRRGRRTRH